MHKTAKIILIVVILIIVVGLIIWAMLNISNQKKQSQTQSTKTTTQSTQSSNTQIPESYQISGIPYYSEQGGFCYGESAKMVLEYFGFDKEKVDAFETLVKGEGQGGPPDIFIGFSNESFDLPDMVYMGYSQDYKKQSKDLYDGFLESLEKQVLLFASQNQALQKLKELVSQDIPVIALVDNGNHYVVVTGYDKDNIYVNDPNPDTGGENKKIQLNNFLDQWNISDEDESTAGKMGFPGDYGMIWLVKDADFSFDEID